MQFSMYLSFKSDQSCSMFTLDGGTFCFIFSSRFEHFGIVASQTAGRRQIFCDKGPILGKKRLRPTTSVKKTKLNHPVVVFNTRNCIFIYSSFLLREGFSSQLWGSLPSRLSASHECICLPVLFWKRLQQTLWIHLPLAAWRHSKV